MAHVVTGLDAVEHSNCWPWFQDCWCGIVGLYMFLRPDGSFSDEREEPRPRFPKPIGLGLAPA